MSSTDQTLQDQSGRDMMQTESGLSSAFISDNPDFDPSRDVPQARGCDTTIGIISNN